MKRNYIVYCLMVQALLFGGRIDGRAPAYNSSVSWGKPSLSVNDGPAVAVDDPNALTRSIVAVPPGSSVHLKFSLPNNFAANIFQVRINFKILPSGSQLVTLNKVAENIGGSDYAADMTVGDGRNSEESLSVQKWILSDISLVRVILFDGWTSIDAIDTPDKFNWASAPADWNGNVRIWTVRNIQYYQTDGVGPESIGGNDNANVKDWNWDYFQSFKNYDREKIPAQTPREWFSNHSLIKRGGTTEVLVRNRWEEIPLSYNYSISNDAHAFEIWNSKAVKSAVWVTNESGVFKFNPEIKNVRLVWENVETPLDRSVIPNIRRGSDTLRIRFNAASGVPEIRPSFIRAQIFRPDATGNIRRGSGLEEYIERGPYTPNNKSDLDWGDFEIAFPATEFNRGGTDFREGLYQADVEYHTIDGNGGTFTYGFRLMGDPPAIVVNTAQNQFPQGFEFSFSKIKAGSRFDVAVSPSRDPGSFRLISRDVINSPPPSDPWTPYAALAEERWEYAADVSQKYQADLRKIHSVLGMARLPDTLYFQFRAIDEVGSTTIGVPYEVKLNRTDLRAPEMTVDKQDGTSALIYDFGELPVLRGTIRDRTAYGNQNLVTLYLKKDNVILSSTSLSASDNMLNNWGLSVPRSVSGMLSNGFHSAILVAIDSDENETDLPISLKVDVAPFDLKVDPTVYSRAQQTEVNGIQKGTLDLKIEARENSFFSLQVDGRTYVSDLFTADQRILNTRFYTSRVLPEGAHQAKAVLRKGSDLKEVNFNLVIDNTPPVVNRVNISNLPDPFLSIQETNQNIVSNPELEISPNVSDTLSPVQTQYAVGDSLDDLSRTLSSGKGQIYVPSDKIRPTPDKLNYLAVGAQDSAGNSAVVKYYPIYLDATPPRIHVGSVEQKSSDYKYQDRNNFWFNIDQAETEPMAARYDLSVSLSADGPWKLITRSVIESAPPRTPWTWNEFSNEEEWLTARKILGKFVPYSISAEKIKSLLGISQFPGTGDQATLYLKARSHDYSGLQFLGQPQPFTIQVDRQAPVITLDKNDFTIIDFDRSGGLIAGHVSDAPQEPVNLKVQLMKDDTLIGETMTSSRIEGEFNFSIPKEKQDLFPNGDQTMKIVAWDIDGNRSEKSFTLHVDVKPLQVELADRVIVRGGPGASGGNGSVDLDMGIVPNSMVSLRINGSQILSNLAVGATQRLQKTIQLPFGAVTGEYPSVIQITKNGKSSSKLFTLVIDNDPPEIKRVTALRDNKNLLSSRDTMMNELSPGPVRIEVAAADKTQMQFRYGTGKTIDSAHQNMMASQEKGNSTYLEIPPDDSQYLAVGVRDEAGNLAVNYYPIVLRLAPFQISINRIEQISKDGSSLDKNLLWIHPAANVEEWLNPRFDLSVSLDQVHWSAITRDVIDAPPPADPWNWRSNAGNQWQNLTGSKGVWNPVLIALSNVRDALKVDTLPKENGKGIFFIRVRGIDTSGNRSQDSISKAQIDLSPYAPQIGLEDNVGTEPLPIVDFGARPGAYIAGWLKDDTPGTNPVDLILLLEGKELNRTRIYSDVGVQKAWQINLPESAIHDLPNGVHELTLRAVNGDGNLSEIKFSVKVDIPLEDIRFTDPLYAFPISREGKNLIRFTATLRENSVASVLIDNQFWLSNYHVSSSRYVDTYLQSNNALSEGAHDLTVRILREGKTEEKKGRLIVKINPPQLVSFADTSGKPILTSHDLVDQSVNFVASREIDVTAQVADAALSEIRFAVDTDPNNALRKIDAGLGELYLNSAHVSLVPNQTMVLVFQAMDKAGLKSQAVLPLMNDTEPPRVSVLSIEQKSQDGKSFDRNTIWVNFASNEPEHSRPRIDVAISANASGPWKLLNRDVVNQPPAKSPWYWRLGSGERWENLFAQGGGLWSPLILSLSEIRGQIGGNLPQDGNGSYFYIRVRSIDMAGNVNVSDPYKAGIQTNIDAPELTVSGLPGWVKIYDVGQYGGLSGTVKDRPFESGNFTQIFLEKNGVRLATTAVRTDADQLFRWDMVIPESARDNLGTGEQAALIIARDADGNETRIPVRLDVEISDLTIGVTEPMMIRSDLLFDRSKKASFPLKATLKENTELAFEVDGNVWASGVNVGSRKDFDDRFETMFALPEGEHQAKITLSRGLKSTTKSFKVIVDNTPPRFVAVTEQKTGQTLREGGENNFGTTDLTIVINLDEIHLKEMRYAIGQDYNEVSHLLASGKLFSPPLNITLPSGTSYYLGIQAEDQSGLITQHHFLLSANTDLPSTSFDSKLFLTSPAGEIASGQVSASFEGRDIYIGGKFRDQDAPGTAEVIGFKKRIFSISDYRGSWNLVIPAEAVPQGEESNVTLQMTGKNGRRSNFPLKIVQFGEAPKILLDQPIPAYLNNRNLIVKGIVKSIAPLTSFESILHSQPKRLVLISNGNVVQDQWNQTEYDPATGRFSLFFQDIEEDRKNAHSLEIIARTTRGKETIYTQDSNGRTTIPFFYVDATPPNPPTLKVDSRIDSGVVLEGRADPDINLSIVIKTKQGKILGRAPVYLQPGEEKGFWSRKLENLPPGDYGIAAYAESPSGNKSIDSNLEKFTVFKGLGSRPKLNDFSKGREQYTETNRPTITGNAGIPNTQVQIFETGNYIGYALANADGNFSFTPQADLKNGWKNFVAVVSDADGQRFESEVLRVYMAVSGVPIEERLLVKPDPKKALQREPISVLVASKEGVPMSGAHVVFVDQNAETNNSGRADLVTPSLNGAPAQTLPIKAEITLPNGIKLSGSSLIDVVAGDQWDIRFSPNGDGIDDYVVFNVEDVPVTIKQWRRDEIVKTVTAADGNRWDGRKANGVDCETDIYLAKTHSGRKIVISLYR